MDHSVYAGSENACVLNVFLRMYFTKPYFILKCVPQLQYISVTKVLQERKIYKLNMKIFQ